MKLREIKFNDIPYKGISIYVDGKEIAFGFIGEVLRKIPIECADYEIESTNPFFDLFVIRLKSKPECYHAACQWSADACANCPYDMDCYEHFDSLLFKGDEYNV